MPEFTVDEMRALVDAAFDMDAKCAFPVAEEKFFELLFEGAPTARHVDRLKLKGILEGYFCFGSEGVSKMTWEKYDQLVAATFR